MTFYNKTETFYEFARCEILDEAFLDLGNNYKGSKVFQISSGSGSEQLSKPYFNSSRLAYMRGNSRWRENINFMFECQETICGTSAYIRANFYFSFYYVDHKYTY